MKPNRGLLKRNITIVDIHPDDLASQLTLADLPIFKSISREELLIAPIRDRHCPYASSSNSIQLMKRQFNQLTFWIVSQVLAHDSPRQRAELISYFIKTARRLHQLNNLHSANAIVSALYSSPIYRLHKTWNHVNKRHPKDKMYFDRLRELFSDNNNYEALRKHLEEAYHGLEIQRTKSTNKILNSLEKFQASQYDDLVPLPDVQYLLLSSRYLDELQKFIEDDNYRRSLELEPPQQ